MSRSRFQPNFLAGPYIDRAAHRRKDPAQMHAALTAPDTLIVPLWRARNLVVRTEGTLTARFLSGAAVGGEVEPGELILLGEFRSQCCLALELPGDMQPPVPPGESLGELPGEFQDLRAIAGELPQEEAGLLAYARAMVLWRERHRYCGRCGAPTVARQGGHVLACSNDQCATEQFPRLDPAIIVLITDGDRVLLGRQASWPAGRYSTIAGFVEPGESLEDAVVREVREETGVEVGTVEYHSSQPWPFPSSLMLGFTAHAISTAIHRADQELEDARWFTRSDLAEGVAGLPFPHSISFRLIEDWYDAQASVPLREEPQARLWKR